ncbi:MAG: 3-isopropylmalate dehydratase small subunit [Burkholderiaceae bacterium]
MRQPITRVEGPVAVLRRDDIDTDALFPAQFLKMIVRQGMGAHLFADWLAAGRPEAAFVTSPTQTRILLAGRNFGCGSSREHAVWALADYGIEAVVALSFGDIFRNNCVKNGIVAATVSAQAHAELIRATKDGDRLVLNLGDCSLQTSDGSTPQFALASGHHAQLLSGEDDISRTLRYTDAIAAHEARVAQEAPWLQRMG